MKRVRPEEDISTVPGINYISLLIDDNITEICDHLDWASASLFLFTIKSKIRYEIVHPNEFDESDRRFKLSNFQQQGVINVKADILENRYRKKTYEYEMAAYRPIFVKIFVKKIQFERLVKSAYEYENVSLLEWIHTKYRSAKTSNVMIELRIGGLRCKSDVMSKWAAEKFKKLPYDKGNIYHVAMSGSIERMKIEINQLPSHLDDRSKMEIITKAAMSGLPMVQWLRNNGFDWSPNIYHVAAMRGDMDLISWAVNGGCPIVTKDLCSSAVIGRSLAILKWAISVGAEWDENSFDHIRKPFGSEEYRIITWIAETNPLWKSSIYHYLAYIENYKRIKYLHNINPKISLGPEVLHYAIQHKMMDTVDWALKAGAPLDLALDAAIWVDDVNLLKKLVCDYKVRMTEQSSLDAAKYGKLTALKWLVQNNCPWDPTKCIKYAMNAKIAIRIDLWIRRLSDDL